MSREEAVLELRRRILQLVARYPGLHVRELARLLDRSQALTDYHVNAMLDQKLIRAQRMEPYVRLYPSAEDEPLNAEERRTLGLLRDRRVLHIALWMLGHDGPARNADIAAGTGMGRSLVTFHLAKLVEGKLVRHRGDDYSLANPQLIQRLLARHQPMPDLREEFSDLWDSLYD